MKKKSLLYITASIAALGLTACVGGENASTRVSASGVDGLKPGPKETAWIIEQDKSQVALLLNKGFSSSIVAINNGKKIKPCKIDKLADKKAHAAAVRSCYPDGHNPDGKILFEETYKLTVREGSTCITVVVGSQAYVFCDPPLDLGF